MIYILHIFKSEIVHDIDFDTLFLQKVRSVGKVDLVDGHIFSSDEKNSYRISRWIEKYYNKVIGILSAYVVTGVESSSDNALPEWEERVVLLNLPENWPSARLQQLNDVVHDYILNSVEYEFFCVSLGQNDPETQSKKNIADDSEDSVSVIINERTTPLHAPFQPF